MLDLLKSFIAELTGEAEGPKPFEAADYQLAAAALLVHIASIDGDFDTDERARIQELVEARFGLSPEEAGKVIANAFVAFVQNTAPWTYLGSLPINPCPDASFDTGLDVFSLRRLKVPTALAAAGRLLRGRGSWDARGAMVTWHDETGFLVEASRPVALQIDGEGQGDVTRVVFTAHPEALTVVS